MIAWCQSGVDFAMMMDLADVDRVREQLVDLAPREAVGRRSLGQSLRCAAGQ